jgi:hypothetical protein
MIPITNGQPAVPLRPVHLHRLLTTDHGQQEHPMRLLFASIHSYLDPSGGAALSTRELLELLSARGADCRALTAGVLDHERETTLDDVLAGLDLPSQSFRADLGITGSVEVIDLTVNGVRITLMPTASSRAERSPNMQESERFLDLADQVLDRFRPHVLLTCGGHPACLELMRRARMKSVAVVFHLHNFGYYDVRAFAYAAKPAGNRALRPQAPKKTK